MRSLTSYLPDPNSKNAVITARLPLKLAEEIKKVAKEKGWTPSDIVRAGLLKFLDENKKNK